MQAYINGIKINCFSENVFIAPPVRDGVKALVLECSNQ